MSAVVINADDLGLTAGVNEGVFEGVDAGVVSDVSLMPAGEAFDHAVNGLQARGIASVGLHFVLVDGERPLSANVDPLLAGAAGFHGRNVLFRNVLLHPRRLRAAILKELDAQCRRLRASGLAISHLDSHQHVHLFPGIVEPVLDFCRSESIPHARLTRPMRPRSISGVALAGCAVRTQRIAVRTRVGLVRALGFESSGCTSLATLRRHMAESATLSACEVIVHPGRSDRHTCEKYAHWQYDWDRELNVLLSARDVIRASGVTLSRHSDLPGRSNALS